MGEGIYGKPTGKKVIYRVIADCLIKDNKVIEEWIIKNEKSILHQLGIKIDDFVKKKISEGIYKKNDADYVKNCYINKNKTPYCESKNAKKYKDYFSKIIKHQRNVYTSYERSAQFYWVGGRDCLHF